MKSLLRSAAIVIAAIALSGCPDKRPEPVPGPQSHAVRTTAPPGMASEGQERGPHGASEISWFQGTLEEAFSRRSCG